MESAPENELVQRNNKRLREEESGSEMKSRRKSQNKVWRERKTKWRSRGMDEKNNIDISIGKHQKNNS